MSTQHPPFNHTYLEWKLQERLEAALNHISNLSKDDVLGCDAKRLTDIVKKFVIAPPLLLTNSMEADREVREVEDITSERKTGQTNHSFFIPVEGEANWFEDVRSQRTAIDDYPLAFLDRKRPRINIRLMLSPEDEEGSLKRKLDYRAGVVKQYADSVAVKLIEFNNDLAEKMLAEFNKRKHAIIKAEKELKNVGLPHVYNPEHEETALQIERLLRSLGAYVTDTPSQQSSVSPQESSLSPSNKGITLAEQLYDKAKGLFQNTKPLDEYTARILVEYADDAVKEFGNTNQEKKVELRSIKEKAEEVLPPKTVEELRKRAEGKAIEKVYPKNKRLRNIVLIVIIIVTVISTLMYLGKMVIGWFSITETSPPHTSTQATPSDPNPNLNLPLIVEIGVDLNKQFNVANKGKVDITEVAASETEYHFNKKAWQEKRLEIEQALKPSGPFFQTSEIKAGGSSETIDLLKTKFFEFVDFETLTHQSDEDILAAQLRNYSIRVTFRDGRTGQRYVLYRVTSGISGGPSIFENLDKTSRSGPPRHFFEEDIPEAIINHQRQLYKNEQAKELAPL